jgi:hypothetical protein
MQTGKRLIDHNRAELFGAELSSNQFKLRIFSHEHNKPTFHFRPDKVRQRQ